MAARILTVALGARLRDPVGSLLHVAGYEVSDVRSASEAESWMRTEHADLVIVDLDAEGQGSAGLHHLIADLRRREHSRTGVLVLLRATGGAHLRRIFETSRLTNFLAISPEEQLDTVELTVTVAKILSRDVFGWARYLGPPRLSERLVVCGSREKHQAVEAVEAFAMRVGCQRRIAEAVAVAADELVTNAIYNAPTDSDGRPRYAQLSRDRMVELAEGEEVTVDIAFDGRRLALAATDKFGSLEQSRVVNYLAKCFVNETAQVDDKAGGAGLGLYYIFNAMHHFIINIAPGRRTEVMGLLEVTRTYKHYSSRTRSFNVFVEE
jgi:hypothetical protein